MVDEGRGYDQVAMRARVQGRALWYPRAVMGALSLTFVLFVLVGDGSDAATGRLGGDFPAFYAAGQLVLDDPDALFDPVAQQERQVELFGSEPADGYLYFAYPPYVALAYAPLAALPYRLAYVIDTVVMVALVALAWQLLRPLIPLVDRRYEHVLYASLLFFPLFRGVSGGQTTAVVLVLLALGFRMLAARRDEIAGLAFAGLLFKPQYALALGGVSLLIGRWRTVVAAVLGSVGLYVVGAAVQGPGWLGPWVDQARRFTEIDAEVNGQNAISWLGAAESTLGVGSPVALALGWPAAVATAAVIAWLWWSDGGHHLPELLAVTSVGVVLLSPHAMFYDAGLVVLALAVLVDRNPARLPAAIGVFLFAFAQALGSPFGLAPNFLLTAGVFVWVLLGLFSWPGGRVRGSDPQPSSPSAAAA